MRLFKIISILALSLSSLSAKSGEVMKSGDTLPQDSYVFTMDEIQQLKTRMEELENKEAQYDILKNLDKINQQKISLYEDTLILKDSQIIEYKKVVDSDNDYIEKQNKRIKNSRSMNYIAFGGGISLTLASIVLADKINDNIIYNKVALDTSTTSIQQTARVTFKF